VSVRQIPVCHKMREQHEQRYSSKFCLKLGDTQVETIRKIQWIKEWYNRFKDGRTSVDSEPGSGRPSTSRNETVIEQVQTLVMRSVHKIRTENANNGADATPSGNRRGRAGQCKQ
jgi:hypothetical protein